MINLDCFNCFKIQRIDDTVYDLLAMKVNPVSTGKGEEVQELNVALGAEVFTSSNINNQTIDHKTSTISPEARPHSSRCLQ